MNKVRLGNTSIYVTPLCFGTLTIGPLQAGLPVDEGAKIIAYALERGVNFLDTAQFYKTYDYIREGIKLSKVLPVISTKSYAYSKEDAEKSLEEARKALDLDVIDIFMLHEQETRLTLEGHRPALEYYIEQKIKGRIRAVGVSTHTVEVANAILSMDEIDVIHPIVNVNGTGISDGTLEDMLKALKKVYDRGIGIFSMKPLGGGSLIRDYFRSMNFIKNMDFIHSTAMGMRSIEEVEMNILFFEGKTIDNRLMENISLHKRKLHIEFWCHNCGKCIERCSQGALTSLNEKVMVDENKCILCGYCCGVCPQFAMKIF